jgi:hypothetical protein
MKNRGLASVLFLVLIASSYVLGAEVSRITQLLHFLNSNVGAEPGEKYCFAIDYFLLSYPA